MERLHSTLLGDRMKLNVNLPHQVICERTSLEGKECAEALRPQALKGPGISTDVGELSPTFQGLRQQDIAAWSWQWLVNLCRELGSILRALPMVQ